VWEKNVALIEREQATTLMDWGKKEKWEQRGGQLKKGRALKVG